MAAISEKIAALRHLLAGRFPDAVPAGAAGRAFPTGLAAIDDRSGGLPFGAITEFVCAAPSCGGHLLLQQLLAATRRSLRRVALVDGDDSFDPDSCAADLLAHLVWVRCRSRSVALQAADLLARDANFGLVVLDLRRAPESDLLRIPGPQWYRLQRAVEPADLALLVITPRGSVPSAQLRFVLDATPGPSSLTAERPALVGRLAPVLQRQRFSVDSIGGTSAG